MSEPKYTGDGLRRINRLEKYTNDTADLLLRATVLEQTGRS